MNNYRNTILIFLISFFSSFSFAGTKENVQALAKMPQFSKAPKGEIVKMVHFLENHTFTQPFYSKKQTGCFCDITYDAATGMKYIHFNHAPVLGKGFFKTVTTAVRFDPYHPEIVARGDQIKPTPLEKKITQYVQGFPSVMKVYGFVDFKKGGKIHYDMYSKYYRQGSLQQAIDGTKKYRFTMKEKIHMMRQMIQAVAALHEHHMVHRDIKLRNFLIDISKNKKGRVIDVVVADLGAARFEKDFEKMQPYKNRGFISPEGILKPFFTDKKEYYAGDVFALGSAFLWILDDKQPVWVNKNLRTQTGSVHVRYKQFIQLLNKEVVAKRAKLLAKQRSKGLTQIERLRLVVYQMVLPDPAKRGTATEIRKQLDAL